jgi:hypothetical protein
MKTPPSVDDAEVIDLTLRAIRIVNTRLSNVLGDASAEEALKLLDLELSEVEDALALVGTVASVGAVAVVILSQTLGVETELLIGQLRSVMVGAAEPGRQAEPGIPEQPRGTAA